MARQITDLARDRLTQAMPYFNRAILYMPVVFYEPKRAEAGAAAEKPPKSAENVTEGQIAEEPERSAAVPAERVPEDAQEKSRSVYRSTDIGAYMKDLPSGIGTNGSFIYAAPDEVIRQFREDPKRISRTYLHIIFHCLFQHPFQYLKLDQRLWDFAADVSVENAVLDCDLKNLALPEDWSIRNSILRIKGVTGVQMTADHLYRWLQEHPEQQDELLAEASLFHRDIHEPWALEDHLWKEMILRRGGDSTGQKWRSISSGVQRDMDSYEKNQAMAPGSLKKIFRENFKGGQDYMTFLRKFARLTEEIHISSDEFDYIYYTYGLQLYRNMPLIEPLEYRETTRIRDFVIALDTSGSCQGSVIRNFLHKTWDVIRTSGEFSDQMNLHIIQCDSRIQRDVKITNDQEFEKYMKEIEIAGSGGTDFRPVFEYVDGLIRQGDLAHMRGLIYFTDGYGTFPMNRPDYQTAFVFVRDKFEIPKVPAWAMRVVLDPADI